MEISKISNNQSFGMKINNNPYLQDVLKYAIDTKQVNKLDSALNTLSHTNEGDVLTIMHGKTAEGVTYSNFSVGKRFIPNRTYDLEPAEASFNALVKLAELDQNVFKKLTGAPAKLMYSISEIVDKYTVR